MSPKRVSTVNILEKHNIYISSENLARKTYLHRRKYIIKLAEFIASLTASCCLTLSTLRSIFFILSFEIRETMIIYILSFIAFVPLKSLQLRSGIYMGFFSGFSARLPGLKILARFSSARAELRTGLNRSPCNRQFVFKRICFRSRAVNSARLTELKFQPGLKFAM